jgi:hypothetical protein
LVQQVAYQPLNSATITLNESDEEELLTVPKSQQKRKKFEDPALDLLESMPSTAWIS